MTTAIPRASRPANGPPTTALPALPVPKTRQSTGTATLAAGSGATTTPRSGLRAPSTSCLPSSASAGSLPQPRSATGINGAGKTLRKTVSINSFPQPPRTEGRVASLPPSPLSGGASTRKLKTPTTPNYHLSNTPSLLNGTGDGKLVARAAGTRSSDGLFSVASPPQSRSSSAQDSYSTSATQYDEIGDLPSSTNAASTDGSNSKRASKLDGKGNVVVSVRVRPDAGGSDHAKTEGEWLVEGRKSLIAYRGKEGGDYYYGESCCKNSRGVEPPGFILTHNQTTFSRPMITTQEYTTT